MALHCPLSWYSCSYIIPSSQGRKADSMSLQHQGFKGTDVTLSDSSLLTLMKQEATGWRGPYNQKWSRASSSREQKAAVFSLTTLGTREQPANSRRSLEKDPSTVKHQMRPQPCPRPWIQSWRDPFPAPSSNSGAKSLWSRPTLCDPMDCSPIGFVCPWASPGKNAGALAVPSSRGSSWPRDRTCIS